MSKKASSTIIGAFVLGAVVLVIAGVVIFGSGTLFSKTQKNVLFFQGSVRGLTVGAPVLFRGVKVGQVTSMQVKFYEREVNILIPVFIEVDTRSVILVNGEPPKDLQPLIKKGLRAQLQLQSFVTGQLVVDLDFYPDKPARFIGTERRYEEIPTIPAPIEELTKTISELPVKEVLVQLNSTLASIERLTNSPSIQRTLNSLSQVIKKIDGFVGRNENLGYLTGETLEDVSRMAKSLHSLADYLDRHPEALIKGKGAGGKGE